MISSVVIYARVSSERQAGEDRVSIEQQLADTRTVCQRNGWQIAGEYVDRERYLKTRPPHKGRRVEPSGKYEDRPQFQEMLATVKTGQIDAIVCWDDSRLMRHLRVYSEVLTALDIAQQQRRGRSDVQIVTASGAVQDRFVLGIMVQVAQRENEDRMRRIKMGRRGTLQAGRWPGVFNQYGYDTRRVDGERGVEIVVNPEEARVVRTIFDMAEQGQSLAAIRRHLIANGTPQKQPPGKTHLRRHQWSVSVIKKMLHSTCYLGEITWSFGNGEQFSIEIPRLVEPAQFLSVQDGLKERRRRYPVEIGWPAILQHLARCGDCDAPLQVAIKRFRYRREGSRRIREEREIPEFAYSCPARWQYPEEARVRGCTGHWYGARLDADIWVYLVENVIDRPDIVQELAEIRRAGLLADSTALDAQLRTKRQRLTGIETERSFLIDQAKKGWIGEQEFHAAMERTLRDRLTIEAELAAVEAELAGTAALNQRIDAAAEILAGLRAKLPAINHSREELASLDRETQRAILIERRAAVQALVTEVKLYANGTVKIDTILGLTRVDGTAVSFGSIDSLLFERKS